MALGGSLVAGRGAWDEQKHVIVVAHDLEGQRLDDVQLGQTLEAPNELGLVAGAEGEGMILPEMILPKRVAESFGGRIILGRRREGERGEGSMSNAQCSSFKCR